MTTPHILLPAAEAASLAEMNHRITNNLALLASMIEVEGRAIENAEASFVLDMTRRRLFAIASVHRRLYKAEGSGALDLGVFLEELGGDLRGICEDSGKLRHVSVQADSVMVDADQAVALGILVAELVGNACKHAYASDASGDVRITLSALSSKGWRLSVEDDGVGLSLDDGGTTPGVGSRIIEATVRRLGASHRWESLNPGTRFVLWHAGSAVSRKTTPAIAAIG